MEISAFTARYVDLQRQGALPQAGRLHLLAKVLDSDGLRGFDS